MKSRSPVMQAEGGMRRVFPALVGIWLGLGFLKFGNPVLFADRVAVPANALELFVNPWPLSWGYLLCGMLVFGGLFLWERPAGVPRWVLVLPGLWLATQVIATRFSIDRALSLRTLLHFGTVTASFYLGAGVLARFPRLTWFWFFVVTAFSLVLVVGGYQHFIGLEETRRYFYAYELPKLPQGAPPELLQKLASNRIYSTLFYPNTLAATILLCGPLLLHHALRLHGTKPARITLAGLAGLAAALCLIWSGSKAGCLIALSLLAVSFLRLEIDRRTKVIAIVSLCVVGLGGFAWRYSGYLEKGATSASARLDYWRAALQACAERPVTGYGPGTFVLSYKRLKRPEAEMTRLAHNDYIQQASDSGVGGFAAFSGFIVCSLYLLLRKRSLNSTEFAAWLGLAGLSAHGFMEFNLYIPALAWAQFLLFGWLWGTTQTGQAPEFQRQPSTKPSDCP